LFFLKNIILIVILVLRSTRKITQDSNSLD